MRLYPFGMAVGFLVVTMVAPSLAHVVVASSCKFATYNHVFLAQGTDEKCWKVNGWIAPTCFNITGTRYLNHSSFTGAWNLHSSYTVSGMYQLDFVVIVLGAHYDHLLLA
jgi:hypothetical protein